MTVHGTGPGFAPVKKQILLGEHSFFNLNPSDVGRDVQSRVCQNSDQTVQCEVDVKNRHFQD